jgi:hypothetical protein
MKGRPLSTQTAKAPVFLTRLIMLPTQLLRTWSRRADLTCEVTAGQIKRVRYVRHLVPLGLLAPPIVEAICSGRQPAMLMAERLKDHGHLSLEWNAQRRQLDH